MPRKRRHPAINGMTKRDWVMLQPKTEPAALVATRGSELGYSITPRHVHHIRGMYRRKPWKIAKPKLIPESARVPAARKQIPLSAESAAMLDRGIEDAKAGRVHVFRDPPSGPAELELSGPRTPAEREMVLTVVEMGLPRASELLAYLRGKLGP